MSECPAMQIIVEDIIEGVKQIPPYQNLPLTLRWSCFSGGYPHTVEHSHRGAGQARAREPHLAHLLKQRQDGNRQRSGSVTFQRGSNRSS